MAWIDIARGLTIVLVVMHHVIRGLANTGMAGPVLLFWHASLTPQMLALFVLLSAFFSIELVAGPRGPFLHRVATLVWVYLVWTGVEFGAHQLFRSVATHRESWSSLAKVAWRPLFGAWFVYALAILLVTARLLRRVDPGVRLALGGVLYVAGFAVPSSGETSLLHDVMQLYVFFEAGLSFRAPILRAVAGAPDWLGAGLVVAYFSLYGVLNRIGTPETSAAFLGLLGLMAPGFMTGAAQLARGPLEPVLGAIGRRSLQIYLIHFLPAGAVHALALRLHLQGHPVFLAVAGTAAAVGVSMLLCEGLVRLRLGFLFHLPRLPRRPLASLVGTPA